MQIPDSTIRATTDKVFSAQAYHPFSPLARVYQWIDMLLQRFFEALGRLLPSRAESPTLYWFTVVVLALVLISVVVGAVWRWQQNRIARATFGTKRDERAVTTYADPWRAAQRLAAEGAFTEAAHALYQALLQGIERQGQLRVHPSKTAGDYVRELRAASSTRFERFRAFARSYETVVYGLGTCDRERYERLHLLATEMLQPHG
ncbi:MAG TPA: DUF4129 domain-containing protein [Gemmatimonadaceae bacterium]|jgi:hypothetical protein|nr:DUF4129 domain-containing protein [Gemmatimonadaceae bacterium]